MKLFTRILLILAWAGSISWGQSSGDYKAVTSGNWNATTTWNIYSGGTWVAASSTPGATSTVYIDANGAGTTTIVTLTQNEAVKDIHINGQTSAQGYGRVALATFTLEVNGKIRTYTGAIPGTSGSATNAPFIKTAASTGVVKIVGNSRNVTNTGEYGSFSGLAASTNGSIEIAMNPGETATFQSTGKFATWTITSGTLDLTGRLAVDVGVSAGTGEDVTVANGATLILNSTGTVMSRTSSGQGGIFTVNGTLILKGAAPVILMNTINFNGTVQYANGSTQTMLTGSTFASPNTYTSLQINNSQVTLGVSTTVNGTLSMLGAAPSLSLGAFTLTYSGSSTLEYAGSSSQTSTNIELPVSGGPNSLKINNSNGVILHASRTIGGTLTLTNGKINLGTNNLKVAGSIVGGSSSSYVSTNGAGGLIRNVGASDVYFPVGYTDTFTPVVLNNSGTADDFTVSVKNTFDNAPYTNEVVNKQWTISEGIPGGSNSTITLQWNTADENGSFVRDNTIFIGRYNGSIWEETSASYSILEGGSYTAQARGFTAFSPFTIGNMPALPIELSSFTSIVNGRDIQLSWLTKTEKNSDIFIIEKKIGSVWESIGSVKASGLSNSPKQYSFIDKNLQTGKYQYRLEMVDNDGSFKFSSIIETQVDLPKNFELGQNYPNPFNPSTRISYNLPFASRVILEVYNLNGELIGQFINSLQSPGYYTFDFNTTSISKNISSGIYFYHINAIDNATGKNFTSTKKMVLIK